MIFEIIFPLYVFGKRVGLSTKVCSMAKIGLKQTKNHQKLSYKTDSKGLSMKILLDSY